MKEIVVQMYCRKCNKEVFPKDVDVREFMFSGRVCNQCQEHSKTKAHSNQLSPGEAPICQQDSKVFCHDPGLICLHPQWGACIGCAVFEGEYVGDSDGEL